MDSNNLVFTKLEYKRLRYNLISDILLIMGAVLAFRQPAMTVLWQILGSGMILVGMLFTILSYRLRSSKQYRELSLIVKREPSSLKEIKNLYGSGTTFLLLFVAIAVMAVVCCFFFLLSKSWIKAILFILALETVIDIKDFVENRIKLKDAKLD